MYFFYFNPDWNIWRRHLQKGLRVFALFIIGGLVASGCFFPPGAWAQQNWPDDSSHNNTDAGHAIDWSQLPDDPSDYAQPPGPVWPLPNASPSVIKKPQPSAEELLPSLIPSSLVPQTDDRLLTPPPQSFSRQQPQHPVGTAEASDNHAHSGFKGPHGGNPFSALPKPKLPKFSGLPGLHKKTDARQGLKPPKDVKQEKDITQVGPRELQTVQAPLLRLPAALQNPKGQALPAGFYLVTVQQPSADERVLSLFQNSGILMTIPLKRNPSANTTPVVRISSRQLKQTPLFFETFYADVKHTVVIRLRENEQAFDSEPLPTLSSERAPTPSGW